VTKNDHGEGVCELIERLIDNDLADIEGERQKFKLLLGKKSNNIALYHQSLSWRYTVSGPSGEGKSTFTTAFMESLLETGYQFVS
jgi:polynucleotide 5'-kinase involved in rRNA processing